MPDGLAGRVIGPMIKSRWLTTAIRLLACYTRTRKPSKAMIRLVHFTVNVYFPAWFQYKWRPHIQDGSINFFYVITLSRKLEDRDRLIVERVLQENAYWAHPENIVLSMLWDHREVVRRKAVLWIMKARTEFKKESHPRQFICPKVDFKVCKKY